MPQKTKFYYNNRHLSTKSDKTHCSKFAMSSEQPGPLGQLAERGANNATVVSSNLTWTKSLSIFCSEGVWSSNLLSGLVGLVE